MIFRALKDVYWVASNEIASFLKNAGYSVNDVGRSGDFSKYVADV